MQKFIYLPFGSRQVIGVALLLRFHGHAVSRVGIGAVVLRLIQRGGDMDACKQQGKYQQNAGRSRMRLALNQHGRQRIERGKGKRQQKIQAGVKQDGLHRRFKMPQQRERKAEIGKQICGTQHRACRHADDQVGKIDAAAPMADDAFVAHRPVAVFAADKKRGQHGKKDRYQKCEGKARRVRRPCAGSAPVVDQKFQRDRCADERQKGRCAPEYLCFPQPGEVRAKQLKHGAHPRSDSYRSFPDFRPVPSCCRSRSFPSALPKPAC